jgi:hypothetical protein
MRKVEQEKQKPFHFITRAYKYYFHSKILWKIKLANKFLFINLLNFVLIFICLTVLSKLITSLNETDKLSGEQELSFLQSLLQSKEINALVNVHHKVAKIGKDDRIAPILSASMQVMYNFVHCK